MAARLVPSKVQEKPGSRKKILDMPNSDPKANLRQQIDENLKRVYQDALSEDVPDRFKALLDQLRQKEKSGEEKS
ncbi:NepR family anti-sigma factor [Pseudorhodobacter sp.]|uniref:NepR family anti-sigma factor n=1 Tax=Pseudorhodobacter sp. TaxID=1934400 RepID=UPI0039E4B352